MNVLKINSDDDEFDPIFFMMKKRMVIINKNKNSTNIIRLQQPLVLIVIRCFDEPIGHIPVREIIKIICCSESDSRRLLGIDVWKEIKFDDVQLFFLSSTQRKQVYKDTKTKLFKLYKSSYNYVIHWNKMATL